MMRIKEAIQRRKLIQQLNDEYAAIGENEQNSPNNNFGFGDRGGSSLTAGCSPGRSMGTLGAVFGQSEQDKAGSSPGEESQGMADHQHAYLALHQFVGELNTRLNDTHRRALRMTWKRLSEAPKTSGRGTLKITEKIFDELVTKNSDVMSIFYRSAFIKCIQDRSKGCNQGTIATVRDHAHLLIDLIDGIMCVMFDAPFIKPVWDPATIGRAHAKLIPMGFDRQIFHKLGECFAEVMFSQECVRAYPLAASAWSTLSVAITDKMYSHTRIARSTDLALRSSRIAAAVSSLSLGNHISKAIIISPVRSNPSTKTSGQNLKKFKNQQKAKLRRDKSKDLSSAPTQQFKRSISMGAPARSKSPVSELQKQVAYNTQLSMAAFLKNSGQKNKISFQESFDSGIPRKIKFSDQSSSKKQTTASKSALNSTSSSSLRRKQRTQYSRPPTLRMLMAQKSHFTAICGLGTQSSSLSLDVGLLNSPLPKVISTPEAMAQRKASRHPAMTKQQHISSSAESTDL